MKYNRIVPTLALAVILSLLMLATPATPALAQTATIAVSPAQGPAGTTVTVTGAVFAANGTITVSYDATPVATGTILADGTFSVTLTASGAAGSHAISATDTTNTVTSAFTITAATTDLTPPLIPQPLSPIMGGKVTSKACFEWESVGADDPSQPITYTLQIASDANFTTIVLEKTGLTTPEYTLTEEEKLEPTTAETLYFWRVKAIDGASNASGWTGVGIFHVGAAFEMTGPILYVVIVLGYILVFFACFWISRRGASY